MVKRKLSQERLFLSGEGDAYFTRNQEVLEERDRGAGDPCLQMLRASHLRPRRVLEIGCSNGWRCAVIHERYGSRCLGIEPSQKAIRAGRRKYPGIRFRRGTIERLPLAPGETFDLVIVYFVLHWVSRTVILKAFSEIDRVVAEGGHLMVGDFLPDRPTRVPYHHLPSGQAYTYKLDYAQVLLDTGLYQRVRHGVFDHNSHKKSGSISPDRRAVCTLLRKSTSEYYERADSRRR